MKTKLIVSTVLASLVLVAGCERDGEVPVAADADNAAVVTPNEAASQAPEAMPETMPSGLARIEGDPAGAPTVVGHTLVESQIPGPDGGAYVVDSSGRAVYIVEGDRDGSMCTGPCVQAWPPLLVGETQPAVGPNLVPSMLGSVQRPDGSMQVTYNGHPLYHYAAGGGRGQTLGHNVRDQFGHWYLITARGEKYTGTGGASAAAGGMR